MEFVFLVYIIHNSTWL